MQFEWDDAKHARTLRERGIGFDDGARIFAGPTIIWQDARHDYGEDRFRAVGETEGKSSTWSLPGAASRCGSYHYGGPIDRRRRHGDHAYDAR